MVVPGTEVMMKVWNLEAKLSNRWCGSVAIVDYPYEESNKIGSLSSIKNDIIERAGLSNHRNS